MSRSEPTSAAALALAAGAIALLLLGLAPALHADLARARDPGVRGRAAGAGGPIAGLTADQHEMFEQGRRDFEEEEDVAGGLGPRFNFVSCGGCHAQPAVGGSSPPRNPLFRVVEDLGFAGSRMPWFVAPDGPVREARVKYNPDGTRDGRVHNLFVITGHPDAEGCTIEQEDFERHARTGSLAFRIPSPTFGAGLIEQVPDAAILANLNAWSSAKRRLGIVGRPNRNGSDGTVSRFGWKAQGQSLLLFSGEAYNVEMGITSELFQVERDETGSCQLAPVPNDVTPSVRRIGAIENLANFQRFLAPPRPVPEGYGNFSSVSIDRGRLTFAAAGCALCHTPTLRTGRAAVAALAGQRADLYSDLLLHAMGPGLADDILQGAARGDEFRTAPLWGLGQRLFFLHDGRTSDLAEAIRAHRSRGDGRFGPSEANAVIDRYDRLGERDKQDLLSFLRSL
jgi:CxxC motif-containing protein (DUF1111 family)